MKKKRQKKNGKRKIELENFSKSKLIFVNDSINFLGTFTLRLSKMLLCERNIKRPIKLHKQSAQSAPN